MDIWIGRNGERHGPYTESDVRQWLRSGQLSREDLAWYEGLADWQPLSVLFPDSIAETPSPTNTAPPMPPPLQISNSSLEDYAGFWQRFGAWVIDLLVLTVPCIVVFYAMDGFDAYRHLLEQVQSGTAMATALDEYATATRPSSIVSIIIGFLYYTLFECSKWQATPGKIALRLRVVDLNGIRLNIGRSAARNFVRLFNIVFGLIPIACYLVVAWTSRKQGLHDMLAHTLVLHGRAANSQNEPAETKHNGSFSA